ncbi:hypothetical protein PY254_12405 [Rhodanobacter sp. AS-Z3]|uniref:hypothetical protein n=1 Tax=Rhodanobacter sp. AS-Z3 TaxID=3031330 RepID=UPI002479F073|nr:hypothetical protein [Rhodanobacter sp. AS-Z3]WEN14036.1 hypothetical protein PY254_12405 [Rhodanobacter sp. AS-Z3]
MLVVADDSDDDFWEQFEGHGRPLRWTVPPKLEVFKERHQKSHKPRADISPFTAEGLIMSSKARDALGDLLSQFGQLLEVDVDGHVEYYFNPTHLIDCVDAERSERRDSAAINKPSFIDSAIPAEAAVFIAPSMPGDIYVNDAARQELERRIELTNITGMSFMQVQG